MQITCRRATDSVSAKLRGELDHHSSKDARDTLESAIKNESVKTLVLDLSHISFMDSSGIGVIIGRYRTMRARDGELKLINVTPQIEKLLKISGLNGLIER